MKKLLPLYILATVFLLFFGFSPAYAAGGSEPQIICECKECKPGEQVTIDVNISSNPGMMYLELTPKCAAELGTPGILNGEIFSDFIGGKQLIWLAETDVSKNGRLLSFIFDVPKDITPGMYDIGLQFRNAWNYNEQSVMWTVISGKLVVKGNESDVSFSGAGLKIENDLKMQFFVDITGNADDVFLEAEAPDKTKEVISDKTLTENGYCFSFGVDPSRMADSYQIRLMNGVNVLHSTTYSVKDYCDAAVLRYPEDTALKVLLANLLEYGAAAQAYTGHNTENPANTSGWAVGSVSSFSDIATDCKLEGTGDMGAAIYGASLRLKDKVSVRFTVHSNDTENLKIKLYRKTRSAEPVLIKEETVLTQNFTVESDELNFYELGDLYIAVLERDGDLIQRLTYSVKSYVAAVKDMTDYPGLSNLVKRLWVYGEQAKKYKEGT